MHSRPADIQIVLQYRIVLLLLLLLFALCIMHIYIRCATVCPYVCPVFRSRPADLLIVLQYKIVLLLLLLFALCIMHTYIRCATVCPYTCPVRMLWQFQRRIDFKHRLYTLDYSKYDIIYDKSVLARVLKPWKSRHDLQVSRIFISTPRVVFRRVQRSFFRGD